MYNVSKETSRLKPKVTFIQFRQLLMAVKRQTDEFGLHKHAR